MMPDYDIDNIEPKTEEVILNRLSHRTFATIVLWLDTKFNHYPSIYVSDLQKFLKRDYTQTYKILKEFEILGIVRFKRVSNIVEILPVKNDDFPVVSNKNYILRAKKTMGFK